MYMKSPLDHFDPEYSVCIGSDSSLELIADEWCINNIGPEYIYCPIEQIGKYISTDGKWKRRFLGKDNVYYFINKKDYVLFSLMFSGRK